MLEITRGAPAATSSTADRMWHYTEGIHNWDPIWTRHGIRILPGPSSLWLDARGRRLPPPLFPGFDTLGTLAHIMGTGHDYTWFVLTQKIIEKEFALSGSEQNPDITGRDLRARAHEPPRLAARRRRSRRSSATAPTSSSSATCGALVARHERAHRRAADRPRRARARDRGARPRGRRTRTRRTSRSTAIHGARRFLADRSSASPRRTASSTPPPAR